MLEDLLAALCHSAEHPTRCLVTATRIYALDLRAIDECVSSIRPPLRKGELLGLKNNLARFPARLISKDGAIVSRLCVHPKRREHPNPKNRSFGISEYKFSTRITKLSRS